MAAKKDCVLESLDNVGCLIIREMPHLQFLSLLRANLRLPNLQAHPQLKIPDGFDRGRTCSTVSTVGEIGGDAPVLTSN